VGDTKSLAVLLARCEMEPTFLAGLKSHCRKLVSLFQPGREKAAWQALLDELKGNFVGSDPPQHATTGMPHCAKRRK
jgi:hypothetical protein